MCRSAIVIGLRAALVFTFLARSVPVAAQTGLVAAYGFNEGSGSAAADASGNGQTAAIAGSAWTAGKFGGALSFDGTADWVTVDHTPLLSLTGGMTLEAWVKAASVTNWRCVILKERSGGLAYALYAGDTGGHAAAFIRRAVDGGDTDATASAVLPLNSWVHVATTYDGATLRTFVGGQQVAATPIAGAIATSTEPLRIGGNAIWGEYFSGAIDEVRVYNRALTAAEIQADMITPVGVAAPVTFGLSGAITPSSGGSGAALSLSGPTTGSVSADANGNYSFSGLGNGTYAVTPSKAGFTFAPVSQTVVINETAATGVNFTATNGTVGNTPDVIGQWGAGFDVGTVAVNMVMLRTGKVLMFSGSYTFSAPERVWDPATGAITLVPNPFYNLFCAGQAQLPDGNILVAGGHDPAGLGAANANIFNPVSQTWSSLPNMSFRRWYPTVTGLPDGRMLVTSGAQTCLTCFADVPEIFDPVTRRFSQLTSARLGIDYYPFMFVLPDGRLLSAGSNEAAYETRTLNVSTGAWSMVDPVIRDGHSAVMYRPGKILKTGTAADSGTTGVAAPTAYVIDMTQSSPEWRQVASMKFPRAFHNMTLLPDGDVLVTGGGTALDGYDVSKGVLTPELWSPASETFKTVSPASFARLYHSTALLLPDARVLIAGSGDDGPAVNQTRAELYSPPYLFKGARPGITAAPDLIQYGAPFTVQTPDAAAIASVALIRPGAVTHGFDEDQRFISLSFTAGAGSLTIQAPVNANLAPPGYYMLFLVNTSGVPSIATFVHFPTVVSDTTPPSSPTNLAGIGGLGSVSLSWSPATDNIAVSTYNVHRSTIPGFAPAAANRIAQTSAPSLNSAGIAPGTYFYVVTAQDAAGNVSGPSNEAAVLVVGDMAAPSVAITAPADQSSVAGSVAVSATATDDVGVIGVQFQIDGGSFGPEKLSPPYVTAWDATLAIDGAHTITAIARDAAGNRSQSTIGVTVSNSVPDTIPPVVSVTSPVDGSTTAGSISVTADATDDVGVIAVQFQVDGAALGAEVLSRPYAATWDSTAVANGPHTVTAVARDAAGQTAQSAVTVVVSNAVLDTTAPVVIVTSPAHQSTATGAVTIVASATDDVGVAGVQFQIDANALGAEKVSAPYTATWDSTTVGNGTHTVTAFARDAAGNRSQASVTVDVLNSLQPPPPPPPPSGLVAAYGFNEGVGTQVADRSGSGNGGTILRAVWSSTGHTGSALSFGNNAWVTVADAASLDLRTGMTLEAWVRPTSVSATRTVLYKERNSGLSYALFGSDAGADPRVSVRTNVDVIANGSTSIRTNTWTHLAATYDGSSLRLFVNGVEVDSTPLSSPMTTSAGPLRIGGNSSRGEYFRGLIDDVRIYNRALSAIEIKADMNRPVE
jgi:concanavalin A-like lectin/glucanase superfamily protein/galactose oxidase-like protein/Big-like domain-containing protein